MWRNRLAACITRLHTSAMTATPTLIKCRHLDQAAHNEDSLTKEVCVCVCVAGTRKKDNFEASFSTGEPMWHFVTGPGNTESLFNASDRLKWASPLGARSFWLSGTDYYVNYSHGCYLLQYLWLQLAIFFQFALVQFPWLVPLLLCPQITPNART